MFVLRRLAKLLWPLLLLCACFATTAYARSPAVALFYGANPPLNELHAFDVTVVEPDNPGLDPIAFRRKNSELFAYASVGEVLPTKSYYKNIPAAWLKQRNKVWGGAVIDQSAADWPAFFAEQVIAPLWAKGYRGFFLDTLDSWHLIARTPADSQQQQAGLIRVIHEIKRRWPDAKLIFNRGFEILPTVHNQVWMVAAESLYQGWDGQHKQFIRVDAQDQQWLRGQLQQVRTQYNLPVLVIDYVPTKQRELARQTAQRIRQDGFIPWVSTPELDIMGVGEIEVLPRKILLLYDDDGKDLDYTDAARFLAMPLAWLGFSIDYLPVNAALPDYPLTGRYAGIVTWFNGAEVAANTAYLSWLKRQLDAGIPLAAFNYLGFGADSGLLAKLGLRLQEFDTAPALTIKQQDTMMGFEMPVQARAQDIYPLRLQDARLHHPLLTLASADGSNTLHPAAITSWGGYVLDPYTVEMLPGSSGNARWYINPIRFLQQALRLDPHTPIADVTTENGRRLLMVHIDGDGFVSKAERAGYPYSGQVMLDEVLKKYRIPTTLSIIEGEIGAQGLYPKDSPALEHIARQMFALPWVEVASHSYSHPFNWGKAEANANGESYHLPIPGYEYDVTREISGSIDYINRSLVPAHKKTQIFLWTGNCVSTPAALAEAAKAGVLNMNGGDTLITRSQNSWTQIAGLGLPKGGYFQVFAPNQNENVYTNLWTGPFYGFERVIETFEMTDTPWRFKPIDIYYHTYAVSKTASLNALHKVYQWALAQSVMPIYSSDYIRKVLDFNQLVIAKTADGYRIRSQGELRTVRLDDDAQIDYRNSQQVAGEYRTRNSRYLHLVGDSSDIVLQNQASTLPRLASSNAAVKRMVRTEHGLELDLQGHVPLQADFIYAKNCQLWHKNRRLPVRWQAPTLHLEVTAHELIALQLRCSS